jgi:hypothetical protein
MSPDYSSDERRDKRLANILMLASRFRCALEKSDATKLSRGLQDFPRGACGEASLLLGIYLQENGIRNVEYVWGAAGVRSHAWLEVDGTIIDITADGFEDVDDSVLVTTDSSWHSRFEEQSRREVNLENCPPETAASLKRAYREIVRVVDATSIAHLHTSLDILRDL